MKTEEITELLTWIQTLKAENKVKDEIIKELEKTLQIIQTIIYDPNLMLIEKNDAIKNVFDTILGQLPNT